ncbi:hypothetical protein Tco_1264467 [Tanacetum coccineum]
MSDSEHSTVTYTSVSFLVEDDSDIGSPGIDGPPIMPEDPYAYIMAAYEVPPSPDYIPGPEVPPSPDYIPGPEVPPSPDYIPGPEVPPSPDYIPGPEEPQSPPPLDFVPEPMYPESPDSVPESDPEEDDEDPEEDPADYPADGDDDDDEDEDEDEEEEEEHPAPANSVPPVHRMTARISIRDEPSISLPPREEVERLLALTIPPPSTTYSTITPLPQIPSPPPNTLTHIEIPKSFFLFGRGICRYVDVLLDVRRLGIRLWQLRIQGMHLVGAIDEIAPTIVERVNQRVTDLATIVEEETTSIVHVISELQSADHRRQRVITELLASDHKRQVQLTKTLRLLKGLQTQMVEFQRQHGPAKPVKYYVMKENGTKGEGPDVNPDATPTPVTDTHTTTSVTNAQIQAIINEGITAALAVRDATRNGDDAILMERVSEALCSCCVNAPTHSKMPTLEHQGN